MGLSSTVEGKKRKKLARMKKGKSEDRNTFAEPEDVDREEVLPIDVKLEETKRGKREKGDGAEVENPFHLEIEGDGSSKTMNGKEIKSRKKKRKDKTAVKQLRDGEELVEDKHEPSTEEVYHISSEDESNPKGMKKWMIEYHKSRPGLKILQQRIDEFIDAHEAKLEQERKERESRDSEDGFQLVVHHKGRKKTKDSGTGTSVGSVSETALKEQMAKKKKKEVGLDFYRFHKREAQRNEIMMLQSKFEQDKRRIQELRAARKFRPY